MQGVRSSQWRGVVFWRCFWGLSLLHHPWPFEDSWPYEGQRKWLSSYRVVLLPRHQNSNQQLAEGIQKDNYIKCSFLSDGLIPWPEEGLPHSSGSAISSVAQDAVVLCHEGTLLTHTHLVHQEPPRPFLPSCFPGSLPPACTGAWGYSYPGAGLCTALCWTSWGSYLPFLQLDSMPLFTTLWAWQLSSASFQYTPMYFYLACISAVCLWGCYGKYCLKSY